MRAFTPASVLLAVLPWIGLGDDVAAGKPQFTGDGQLQRPVDYRTWPVVGASLGLSYSDHPAPGPGSFHRVYLNPSSYSAYLRTGTFPDGAMFVLEIHEARERESLLRGGFFEGKQIALESSVKDRGRFPQGWAYFSFDEGDGASARPIDDNRCHSCHRAHGQVDSVFVQFYPNLRDR